MARAPAPPLPSPLWSRRLTEWCLVALILLGLGFAFEREIRSLQAQGERVFALSTLASLRTTLVLNRLARQVRPNDRDLVVKNPFLLLEPLPSNYAGEVPMRDVHRVPPGSWVFDPDCLCVGYRLLYPEWLEPAQDVGAIWYRVGGGAGPASLSPLADYRWLGTHLN